jgi:hypothetical protein
LKFLNRRGKKKGRKVKRREERGRLARPKILKKELNEV